MDKTTTWLIRGAAGVFILLGLNYLINPSRNMFRVIQGKTELTGNSCPSGHGYSGAGYCTRVVCLDHLRHHPDLKDKGWECPIVLFAPGKPKWGEQSLKAVFDPRCPNREPIIGTKSSCETHAYLDEMRNK